MISEKDFSEELLNNITDDFKKILVDFANNFLDTFGKNVTKETIIKRINALKYIGFQNDEPYIDKDTDAAYIHGIGSIFVSNNFKNADPNTLKSLVYHELIHAMSYHIEKANDIVNTPTIGVSGLWRDSVYFDPEYDGPDIDEGCTLDEIMTEYYNTVLLQKEGIDFNGEFVFKCNFYEKEYVEYHGTGYQDLAALGQIYQSLFGEELFKAKLYDGNDFRTKFNEFFDKTEIFKDIGNDAPFKLPSYSKFVGQREPIDRYRTACKMFAEIFKSKHKDDITNIDQLLNNEEFNNFMNMLIKVQDKLGNKRIQDELFDLTKGLEKDLANELFCNKMEENEYGNITEDVDMAIYIALENIYEQDNNIDLNNVKYSVFYDNHYKGILLQVGNDRYVVDCISVGQIIDYAKFENFKEYGFSEEEIKKYSEEFNMDVSNASFATTVLGARTTFLLKDNKLFNIYGNEIELDGFKDYKTKIENDSMTR